MYTEKDLVRIAKRENNNKRKYLIVNRLQGKHIPTTPSKAISMFSQLAETVKEEYKDEKLLVIGFAETATAIGTQVAICLNSDYMQTTREIIPNVEYLFFSEEHSHATEQKLVKNDIDSVITKVDRILFVEDEVSTGKTIMNIISILKKKYSNAIRYGVVSILNGMNEEHIKLYRDNLIDLHYLVKTEHSGYTKIAEGYEANGENYYKDETENKEVFITEINNYMNTRRITNIKEYENCCKKLWDDFNTKFQVKGNEKILVLGTEEFMYPALYIANEIEKEGAEVKSHSTTRSPIAVSNSEVYPLHTRYELNSVYDKNRTTYIYSLDSYDRVFIITDSNCSKDYFNTLINALKNADNDNINIVRWC